MLPSGVHRYPCSSFARRSQRIRCLWTSPTLLSQSSETSPIPMTPIFTHHSRHRALRSRSSRASLAMLSSVALHSSSLGDKDARSEVCSAGGICSVCRDESLDAVSGKTVACERTIDARVLRSSDLGITAIAVEGSNRSGYAVATKLSTSLLLC